MEHPLVELQRLGQSPWHDNIHRGLLASGALARMVRDGDITGLTSNPTIFEQAIAHTGHYDGALAALVAAGRKAEQIVDTLTVEDIRAAADVFLPVFQRTGRTDGFVSIEVAPTLANDTDATIREAKRLWRAVNRQNLMVKIPATRAGLPAIAEAIASGINVNVTLIFSLERYAAVMDAYMSGLERRQEAGMRLDRLASVASFFVSRVDTLVDKLLDARIGAAAGEQRAQLERLRGKAAIAQAKMAYQLFRTTLAQDRFTRLARDGARPQRPLWASTSTKSPAYPDVYYVEALVGPDTVNTMPPVTLAAYKDHGHPELRIEQAMDKANQVMKDLAAVGIDMSAVTAQLEDEGVASFATSWRSLLDVVATRREALRQEARTQAVPGPVARPIERALGTLASDRIGERLSQHDATLWPASGGTRDDGAPAPTAWVDQAGAMPAAVAVARRLLDSLRADAITHVVACGDSALLRPAAALRRAFGVARNGLDVSVLDVGDTAAVHAAVKRADPARTAWLLAGDADDATPLRALLSVVWPRLATAAGDRAARHVIALAAPGSGLERLARERNVPVVEIPRPPEARWTPLGPLSVIPVVLLGHDADRFVERAERMATACSAVVPPVHNPALRLGALLAAQAAGGRDKLTIVAPDRLDAFAGWVAQLVAAGTARAEHPIVPVLGEPLGPPALYGKDRAFLHLKLGTSNDRTLTSLARAGHPALTVKLADAYDLAAEMLRWTLAVAVAARLLETSPFAEASEPVARAVREALDAVVGDGAGAQPVAPPAAADLATRVAAHLGAARGRRWVALLSYVSPSPKRDALLTAVRAAIRKRFGVATALGKGAAGVDALMPLLAGGSTTAIPIVLHAEPAHDVPVPGERWTFAALEAARARATLSSLRGDRRAPLYVDLGAQPDAALGAVLAAVQRKPRPAPRRAPRRTPRAARARAAGRR